MSRYTEYGTNKATVERAVRVMRVQLGEAKTRSSMQYELFGKGSRHTSLKKLKETQLDTTDYKNLLAWVHKNPENPVSKEFFPLYEKMQQMRQDLRDEVGHLNEHSRDTITEEYLWKNTQHLDTNIPLQILPGQHITNTLTSEDIREIQTLIPQAGIEKNVMRTEGLDVRTLQEALAGTSVAQKYSHYHQQQGTNKPWRDGKLGKNVLLALQEYTGTGPYSGIPPTPMIEEVSPEIPTSTATPSTLPTLPTPPAPGAPISEDVQPFNPVAAQPRETTYTPSLDAPIIDQAALSPEKTDGEEENASVSEQTPIDPLEESKKKAKEKIATFSQLTDSEKRAFSSSIQGAVTEEKIVEILKGAEDTHKNQNTDSSNEHTPTNPLEESKKKAKEKIATFSQLTDSEKRAFSSSIQGAVTEEKIVEILKGAEDTHNKRNALADVDEADLKNTPKEAEEQLTNLFETIKRENSYSFFSGLQSQGTFEAKLKDIHRRTVQLGALCDRYSEKFANSDSVAKKNLFATIAKIRFDVAQFFRNKLSGTENPDIQPGKTLELFYKILETDENGNKREVNIARPPTQDEVVLATTEYLKENNRALFDKFLGALENSANGDTVKDIATILAEHSELQKPWEVATKAINTKYSKELTASITRLEGQTGLSPLQQQVVTELKSMQGIGFTLSDEYYNTGKEVAKIVPEFLAAAFAARTKGGGKFGAGNALKGSLAGTGVYALLQPYNSIQDLGLHLATDFIMLQTAGLAITRSASMGGLGAFALNTGAIGGAGFLTQAGRAYIEGEEFAWMDVAGKNVLAGAIITLAMFALRRPLGGAPVTPATARSASSIITAAHNAKLVQALGGNPTGLRNAYARMVQKQQNIQARDRFSQITLADIQRARPKSLPKGNSHTLNNVVTITKRNKGQYDVELVYSGGRTVTFSGVKKYTDIDTIVSKQQHITLTAKSPEGLLAEQKALFPPGTKMTVSKKLNNHTLSLNESGVYSVKNPAGVPLTQGEVDAFFQKNAFSVLKKAQAAFMNKWQHATLRDFLRDNPGAMAKWEAYNKTTSWMGSKIPQETARWTIGQIFSPLNFTQRMIQAYKGGGSSSGLSNIWKSIVLKDQGFFGAAKSTGFDLAFFSIPPIVLYNLTVDGDKSRANISGKDIVMDAVTYRYLGFLWTLIVDGFFSDNQYMWGTGKNMGGLDSSQPSATPLSISPNPETSTTQ